MFQFQRFVSQDFYLSRMNPGGQDSGSGQYARGLNSLEAFQAAKEAFQSDLGDIEKMKAYIDAGDAYYKDLEANRVVIDGIGKLPLPFDQETAFQDFEQWKRDNPLPVMARTSSEYGDLTLLTPEQAQATTSLDGLKTDYDNAKIELEKRRSEWDAAYNSNPNITIEYEQKYYQQYIEAAEKGLHYYDAVAVDPNNTNAAQRIAELSESIENARQRLSQLQANNQGITLTAAVDDVTRPRSGTNYSSAPDPNGEGNPYTPIAARPASIPPAITPEATTARAKLDKELTKEAETACKKNDIGKDGRKWYGAKKFDQAKIDKAVKAFKDIIPTTADPDFLKRAQALTPNFIKDVTAKYFSPSGQDAAKETVKAMSKSIEFINDTKQIIGNISGANARALNDNVNIPQRDGFKRFAQEFQSYGDTKPFPINAIVNPKNKELVNFCAQNPELSASAMQAFRTTGQESGLSSFKPIDLEKGVKLSVKAANSDVNRTPEEKKLAAQNIAELIGSDAVNKGINGGLSKGAFSQKAIVSEDKYKAIERGVNDKIAKDKTFGEKMNKNFGLGGDDPKDKKALNFNPIDNFKATFRFIDGKNAAGKPISRTGALLLFPFRAAKLVVSVVVATPIALIRTAIQTRAEKKNHRLEEAANNATKYPKVYAAVRKSLSNGGKDKVTNRDLNLAMQAIGQNNLKILENSTLKPSEMEASFNVQGMRNNKSKEAHSALQNLIKSHEKKEPYKGGINTLILKAEGTQKPTPAAQAPAVQAATPAPQAQVAPSQATNAQPAANAPAAVVGGNADHIATTAVNPSNATATPATHALASIAQGNSSQAPAALSALVSQAARESDSLRRNTIGSAGEARLPNGATTIGVSAAQSSRGSMSL